MPIDRDQFFIEPVLPAQPSDVQELTLKLRAYNQQQAGVNNKQNIGCFIRDLQDNLIGGIYAQLTWGWCCIELLWIDDKYRGHNLARELVNKIEQHANDEGIDNFKVETASFQALEFYQKMGYELYATLDNFPIGHQNHYLNKVGSNKVGEVI
ncbi:MAG: GNAT family N-acetyltransferase [Gammaproteobacteria bacterium]|nr:GNAT family N-acetyltransferase [Gammaproteobacteria bacterium]